jgi:ABC-type polysaccharide transport system permease subunit
MFSKKDNSPIDNTFSTKNTFSHYSSEKVILAIIFTILLFLISLTTFLYDFLISIKEYTPLKGIFNSANVGLTNYRNFISSHYFGKLLSNTIVQSLLFGIFVFFISMILGVLITSLPSRSMLSNTLATFMLIPVFAPDVVYVSWFMNLFSPAKPFIVPNIAMWFIPLIRALKYAGIPVLITLIMHEKICERKESQNFSLALQVSACFALFSIMFITINDITITSLAINPLVYETIDSFNLFTYRTGLLSANFSNAAAVSIIGRLLCLITAAILFLPFKKLAESIFHRNLYDSSSPKSNSDHDNISSLNSDLERHSYNNPNGDSYSNLNNGSYSENEPSSNYMKPLFSTIIALVLGLFIFVLPFLIRSINIFDLEALSMLFQNSNVIGAFPLSIIVALIAAAINVALSAIVAYPIACSKTSMKRVSIILILLIAVIASTPISLGTYMLFRSIGIFNTAFALILGLISPITGVWAFVAIANYQNVPEGSRYSKAIAKPAIALLLVQFVYCFNNYFPSLIYTSDRRLYTPSMLYRELALVGGEAARQIPQYGGMVFWYGFILSIIPVAILAVLRICFNKSSLLSILGMSQRR